MMHLVRLKTSSCSIYEEAEKLYKDSFPVHEQRDSVSQKAVLAQEEYCFYLIYDESDFVGILLCWERERFIYVEHFCIGADLRNRRYGQRALDLLKDNGKTVILEIDPPVDEISERRKGFYERSGYKSNSFEHVHPPYLENKEGHKLLVMSYPEVLSRDLYDEFDRYLNVCVMGDRNES